MNTGLKYADYVPQIVPQNMNGTVTSRIVIKKDHKRTDGTCALYLVLYHNGERKRIPLGIAVPLEYFDVKGQKVKPGFKYSEDYNLLIGKKLADLNSILVNYRLSGAQISMKAVLEDLERPSLRANFNEFADNELKLQKELYIKGSTYLQQKGALEKIKRFQDPILFSQIDAEFIARLKAWCKSKGNSPATVSSTLKNFKKYLHLANRKGIQTPISYEDIKIQRMVGERTFLTPLEVKKMYGYYHSDFISDVHKDILQRYLFSCFTGIRISDIEQLTRDHLFGDYLGFTMSKTSKFIRIKLNNVAMSLIGKESFFTGQYTRKHINEELKHIAKTLGIRKRLYFHSSRHTFATNFLISGGDVVNLQKVLGHGSIKETMIYVHIVESITDKQVDLLDEIIR